MAFQTITEVFRNFGEDGRYVKIGFQEMAIFRKEIPNSCCGNYMFQI